MTVAPGELLADGSRRTRADWEAAAAAVLRRAGRLGVDEPDAAVWERLATTTLDGVVVPPLGPVGDRGVGVPAEVPGELPFTRGREAGRPRWDVRVVCDGRSPARANADALEELETGASSLWLRLPAETDRPRLDALLAGVRVDLAPVVLHCPEDPAGAARGFAGWLGGEGVAPAAGTSLGADPIGRLLATPGSAAEVPSVVAALAEPAAEAGVGALVVDGTLLHDRGASDAQELGYALAAGAAYLRVLTGTGLGVDDALGLLDFRFAATDEQLPTTAKLRAARRTWARVCELSGASPAASAQRQHAVTSRPMLTRYDAWTNLMRTTVAAFAALVGGADAVTVVPYDAALGRPSGTGRRWARNIPALLSAEGGVARVRDPAGGSYAVERLTDDLADAAWAELDRIERSGGVLAALADGSLLGRTGEVSARRRAGVATRRRPVTGVSEFPEAAERRPPERPAHLAGDWDVASYAAEFEALRDAPKGYVFLATMGPLAEHAARARFVENLLDAGGVVWGNPGPLHAVGEVLASYEAPAAVCLVGSDAAYAAWGADLVRALREAGARRVILAGRPGPATVPAELVDDFCAAGEDAVAFLRRTREASR